MNNKKTVFEVLSAVDVSARVQKKGKLTYLSWAWAWGEVAKRYPDANYEVYRNPDTNLPYDFVEGSGYMAYTTVTIEGKSLSMWLPVIDYNNKSILSNATTFDVNKTLMRCLTKNLAMHGLGHYIYAGEDLPETPIETTGKVDLGNKPKNLKVDLGDDDFDEVIKKIKTYLGQKQSWDSIIERMKTRYNVTEEQLVKIKNKTK